MNIEKTSFFLIFAFVSLSLFAQKNYDEAIQQGDDAFQRAEYTTAITKYLIAEKFDQSKWKTVQEKLDKVYKAIDAALAANTSIRIELDQLKSQKKPQSTPSTAFENPNDGVRTPTSPTVSTSPKPPPPPKPTWNDFLRLYNKRADQWFVNIGYGINIVNNITNNVNEDSITIIGNDIGFNVGYRHAIINNFGIGYQAGIGLGVNKSGTYLHWALGVKIYPWNCFFISANYGAVGMKKYSVEKLQNPIDEPFYYYKKVNTEFYHGLSLLGGADICFGKRTTDKFGGIINIAAGTVYTKGKWGFALNLGMGLVFKR